MYEELAETGNLTHLMQDLGKHLDRFLDFKHPDAFLSRQSWQAALNQPLPNEGIGIDSTADEIQHLLIPNASAVPNPGCTSFITTGATSVGALASAAASVVAPQRIGLTAFNYLEEKSLEWLAALCQIPQHMKGLYSSGGSAANIVGLGAARQQAFESIGLDPAQEGVNLPCRIYATQASHHTIHRAAAVLGIGRNAVIHIPTDERGRMCVDALHQQLLEDKGKPVVPVAIVANAGSTSTGSIDPLQQIGELAQKFNIWFHIDGAYGLPGVLDPNVQHLYQGVKLADSLIVDPHKWLGAPVGIGATFVRDRNILNRAFSQGASDYLEGSVTTNNLQHSMDSLGIPYSDFGLELSAPCRGAVVWALIREIGKEGMQARVCRHNAMASWLAEQASSHPNLELLQQPTLSICCIRYVSEHYRNTDELNRRIHRLLVKNGRNIPSTAMVNGQLAIRPCFIGARTDWQHAESLLEEILLLGKQLENSYIKS